MGMFKDLLEKSENEKEKLEAVVAPFAASNTETIRIDQLIPLHTKVFKNYDGDKLERLVQSIKEHGILNPVLVRPLPDGTFEVLSGNNRVNAARLASLTEIPARILENLTDDEANLIALETNFCQRSMDDLQYSERAAAIAEWYEIQKRQGLRTDLINEVLNAEKALDFGQEETSRQIGEKLNTNEKAEEKFNLSGRNISRFLRINLLIEDFKEAVDKNTLPFNAAVNLSYLNEAQQLLVYQVLSENETLSLSLFYSDVLKKLAKSGKLDSSEDVLAVLSGEKKVRTDSAKVSKVVLKPKLLSKYFDTSNSEKEISEYIEKAIAFRKVTIPTLLAEYGVTEDAEEVTEKALKFYLQSKK